ncbi:MAG: SHOCT domain-containing protein [Pseudodesulfovibrio sp.]|nr:SHOCT domain-containing protein [Pseudodesulfovibrio sp.]
MEILSAFGNWCGGTGFWQGSGASGWHGGMPFHFGGILQIMVIGLIIYFFARMFRHTATTNGAQSPHDILKNRYAAGEIDKETFVRMKDELK